MKTQCLIGIVIWLGLSSASEIARSDPLLPSNSITSTQLVLPGSISAHTHFYSTFARGMTIPGSAPQDFPEILGKLWWRLDSSLAEEDVRLSALVALVDAIRNGTTTLFDPHASPAFVDGSLDVIAEAVEQAGVRAVLCYEVSDRGGSSAADAGIRENVRFMRRLAGNPSARLAANFGLHASLTLSGATLQACRAALPGGCRFPHSRCRARAGSRRQSPEKQHAGGGASPFA